MAIEQVVKCLEVVAVFVGTLAPVLAIILRLSVAP